MDKKEVELFFRAFFTPQELETLDHRYRLVELLVQGLPQREIADRIGVSISQISRGSQELKFGYGKKIFPQLWKH